MPKHVEPSIGLNAFSCARCGALADQIWYNLRGEAVIEKGTPFVPRPDIEEYMDGLIEESSKIEEIEILKENKIKYVRLLDGDVFIFPDGSHGGYSYQIENLFASKCFSFIGLSIWKSDKIVIPKSNFEFIPNEDLRDDIKEDFNEAAGIVNDSPRGSVALLRLCIQKLCVQVGQKGKNINDDIAALVKEGLSARIQQALDIVRVTGNNAVHPGQIDLKDDRATAVRLFELINIIADATISQPKQIAALYDNLPQASKDAIIKRDGKTP